MSPDDPQGYYAVLGLQPTATPALLKAAYRVRAMELHPDRNPATDTTQEFQALQRAFEVLSDPQRRRAYDDAAAAAATARAQPPAAPPPARAAAPPPPVRPLGDTGQHVGRPSHAMRCTRCHGIPTLPRYCRIVSVRSHGLGATQKVWSGVYCDACEALMALRATGTTLLLGWWSVSGVPLALKALANNLFGGPAFPEQNARLLAAQASHFASIGLPDIARPIAAAAFDVARRCSEDPWWKAQWRRLSGRPVHDPLHDLKEQLREFIAATPSVATPAGLRVRPRLVNLRSALQLAVYVLLPAALYGAGERLWQPRPEPPPAAAAPDAAALRRVTLPRTAASPPPAPARPQPSRPPRPRD